MKADALQDRTHAVDPDLIRAEQVRLLADGTTTALMVAIVNVGLLAFVQRAAVSSDVIIGWTVSMIVIMSLRLFLNFIYYHIDPPASESLRWMHIFTAVSFVTGTGWGSIGFLMMPADSLPHQVFVAFVCAGMGAGAMASLYPLRNVFMAFAVPLLLPIIIRSFSEPDEIHVIMGTMISLFLLYILAAGARLRATLEETLVLRFANEALDQSLNQEATARAGSELRYRNLIDNAADAIFVHDLRGGLLDVNQQACESLGYQRRDLMTLNVTEIETSLEPDTMLTLWHQQGANAFPLTMDGVHARRDGSTFPVEVRIALLDDRDGPRFIAAARDVTERKKVDRMKSEFISTVSHELRTPLTSIVGSLGLLSATNEFSQKSKSMLSMAERNTKRLIDLVDDILTFETLESGRMQFEMVDFDLAHLVSDAMDVHLGFAEHHGGLLVIDTPLPHAFVQGDEKRLGQVLSNFLSNALKFSSKGDEVRISLAVADGRARVSVIDHGDGIPSVFHDQIFNRFSQAGDATTRRQGGTGLGLAISKGIIDQHGGVIGFESEEGRGSTFYFELPVV